MESGEWKALINLVPEDYRNSLVVMTTAGTEINIQSVLRLEKEFMVLRGRLAGTTDNGRIFFLPFDHLDYLGFQRVLTEGEIMALLDGQPMPGAQAAEGVPAVASSSQPEAAEPPAPEPAPPPTPPPAAAPAREGGLLARLPSRSQVLQRLRLRSAARTEEGNRAP